MISNSLLKYTAFGHLNRLYPKFDSVLMYLKEGKAIVKTGDDVKEVSLGTTLDKYLVMLAESKGMKRIDQIYIQRKNEAIVLRGDIDVTL
jgi:hypothetical protein